MNINIIQQPWDISKRQLEAFTPPRMEKMIRAFNHACSGEFYMVDSFLQKIIVDSQHSAILCGYPKEVLEQENFAFYSRILSSEEAAWVEQMNAAALAFFFKQEPSARTQFVISYDLAVIMRNGEKMVLHHKVVPYRLCRNGNLWLRLCYVAPSTSKSKDNKAIILNRSSQERYTLQQDQFILSPPLEIGELDMHLLKWMVQGLSDHQMSSLARLSLSAFKAKKRALFSKLDVNSSASAIHAAHLIGLL